MDDPDVGELRRQRREQQVVELPRFAAIVDVGPRERGDETPDPPAEVRAADGGGAGAHAHGADGVAPDHE